MINQELAKILKDQRDFFDSFQTFDINKRKNWLNLLKNNLIKYEDELLKALNSDLGRDEAVGFMTELQIVYHELHLFYKNIKKWSKDTKVKSSLLMFHKKAKIVHNPHGQVYLIVPFNFPILLSLQPLVASIACGNVTFLKMSNMTPNVNQVLKKILAILPKEVVYFLDEQISSEDRDELNKYPWDFIFFTGSKQTASKIYASQYHNFIPSVFELGGKSPMVIDDTINLELACKKYLNTKLINAGQICVAADYLIIKKNVEKDFVNTLQKIYNSDFAKASYFTGNLISEQKAIEVNNWLEKQDKLIINDHKNVKGYDEVRFAFINYLDAKDTSYLDNELFAPIGYYHTYSDNEEIINIVKKHNFPLAFYCFSNDQNLINYLKTYTQSGAFVVNDTLIHVAHPNLPFGGIKNSGLGKYHAKQSFETFSVNKAYLNNNCLNKLVNENKFFEKNYWIFKKIRKRKK